MNTINLNNEKNVVGKSKTTGKAMNIDLWIVQILTVYLLPGVEANKLLILSTNILQKK